MGINGHHPKLDRRRMLQFTQLHMCINIEYVVIKEVKGILSFTRRMRQKFMEVLPFNLFIKKASSFQEKLVLGNNKQDK
jgi:hypothetical protein